MLCIIILSISSMNNKLLTPYIKLFWHHVVLKMIDFVGNSSFQHFLEERHSIWIYYSTNQVFIRMPRGLTDTIA